MSVLRCDRGNCENILCDRYSRLHGYICDKCFDELVSLGDDAAIYQFMRSKKSKPTNKDASYNKWNEEFSRRD